jgi:iron-sulfur cluster assembly protein
MIKVTENAGKQIKASMESGDANNLGLRIAAMKNPDGSFKYAMGFDELKSDDIVTEAYGIKVMYAGDMAELLDGMTIEFDRIEKEGDPQFIFLNPNDPSYVPPSA